jgi:hypothetical protein
LVFAIAALATSRVATVAKIAIRLFVEIFIAGLLAGTGVLFARANIAAAVALAR